MIHDLALRWLVTILFVLAVVECLYALAVGNRRPATVVSQLLHVVMALAMAVMAWPWGAAPGKGAGAPGGPVISFLRTGCA